jgi:hypothetical protein
LSDILGGRPVARELQEKAEERTMVAFKELAEGVEIAVADSEHERMVGALFGRGFHGSKTRRRFNHGGTRMNMDFF